MKMAECKYEVAQVGKWLRCGRHPALLLRLGPQGAAQMLRNCGGCWPHAAPSDLPRPPSPISRDLPPQSPAISSSVRMHTVGTRIEPRCPALLSNLIRRGGQQDRRICEQGHES